MNEYHHSIIEYYHETEHAYRDSWDLDNSHAIHYGYWDDRVKNFPQSLMRMNEVMAETAAISETDHVLDAGCGIGGSSLFLAERIGCKVTGISLSKRQVKQARGLIRRFKIEDKAQFEVMDYCHTSFPDQHFDVVWGCESICYAENKETFIKEAWRILKPGGRLVVADGFVTAFENNDHPSVRKWLDGWQVNYLETMERFQQYMQTAGFDDIKKVDISHYTMHSSRRLYRIWFLAKLYLIWKKVSFSYSTTDVQKKNIEACRYQWLAVKKGLWQYGLITGRKQMNIN